MARKKRIMKFKAILCTLGLVVVCGAAYASDQLNIAAASNLTYVMPKIIKVFEEKHEDIKVRLSLSSTGSLYSQIINGAPFDLFLAADEIRPRLLSEKGLTEGKPFTYARGALVLWSSEGINFVEGLYVLSSPNIRKVALANPKHAPYGEAAREVLEEAGLWEVLKEKFIFGENIGQTAQFVQSGSAQIGFIAESHLHNPAMQGGSFYRIPEGSYKALIQRGVILNGERKNIVAASKFRDFLASEEAKKILRDFGYGVE